jgi:hypothetical protein
MDDKKRSRAVVIFGWLMIIINAFVLLATFNTKSFFDVYKSFPNNFLIAMYAYSLISPIIGIIAGIGILKLKDLMRKVGIFINSLDILGGIPLFFLSIKDLQRYCYTVALSSAPSGVSQVNAGMIANISFYIVTILSWGFIGLSILFIYFFTRPKVREQFK